MAPRGHRGGDPHGNARSPAQVLSDISRGGEAGGIRLLERTTIDLIFDEQSDGMDLVLGMPLRRGIGYALSKRAAVPWIPDERIYFWGGWGGSVIIMDVGRRMTISYVMNKMASSIIGSDRSARYTRAIYQAFG
ncbi:serine hydrolase [Spongiactinospora rosea]|uniref:serine hydrolase n=1 Tax=Spongiactinospora rosea TaxID=2248750 RepID=UPI0018F419D4|nr:serine hydrolase [Spongiactinospora rosea]